MSRNPFERRVMRKLGQLVANRQMSGDALDWLVCGLDPMHDTEISCKGYPDVSSAKSIVQCVTKTIAVNASELGLAEPWDAHVFFLPVSPVNSDSGTYSNVLLPYIAENNGLIVSAVNNAAEITLNPGVNVIVQPAGTSWDTPIGVLGGGTFSGAQLPQEFCSGQFRLIGVGWEVVDTSPVIFKQGALTCYRMPCVKQNNAYVWNLLPGTPTYPLYYNAEYGVLPPKTQNEAVLYPNSRTWANEKGVYQVGTLNDSENQYIMKMAGLPVFQEFQSSTNTAAGVWMPALDDSLAPTAQPTYPRKQVSCSHVLPFDTTGVILTNMNPSGTIQVTVRYYIEKIPTTSDSNLLVLARTPTSYDPVALEIYSRATQELPVAVPVGENPLGEWFDKLLAAIADALPLVGAALSTVFSPALPIATTLSTGARALSEWNAGERNREKGTVLTQPSSTILLSPGGNTSSTNTSNVNSVRSKQARRMKPLPPTPARRKQ